MKLPSTPNPTKRRASSAILIGLATGAILSSVSCQTAPPVADIDGFDRQQQATQPATRAVPDGGEDAYLRQGWTGNRYGRHYGHGSYGSGYRGLDVIPD